MPGTARPLGPSARLPQLVGCTGHPRASSPVCSSVFPRRVRSDGPACRVHGWSAPPPGGGGRGRPPPLGRRARVPRRLARGLGGPDAAPAAAAGAGRRASVPAHRSGGAAVRLGGPDRPGLGRELHLHALRDRLPGHHAPDGAHPGAHRNLEPAFHLVSISVDPEYDTPARLAAYASAARASPRMWTFLTGPADAVRSAVTGGLRVSMGGDPADRAGGHLPRDAPRPGGRRGGDPRLLHPDAPDAVDRVVRDAALLVNRG